VFVGLNFVLSLRSRSTHGFLAVRERAERETHLLRHGFSFVFYGLMDAVVGLRFPVIDAMEGELETIEGDEQTNQVATAHELSPFAAPRMRPSWPLPLPPAMLPAPPSARA